MKIIFFAVVLPVFILFGCSKSIECPSGSSLYESSDGLAKYCQKKVSDGSFIKNGPHLKFYSEGKLKEKCNYLDGKLEGEFVKYYDNGKPEEEVIYHADMKQFLLQKEYYSSGVLKTETSGTGIVKHYRDNSKLWYSSQYYFKEPLFEGRPTYAEGDVDTDYEVDKFDEDGKQTLGSVLKGDMLETKEWRDGKLTDEYTQRRPTDEECISSGFVANEVKRLKSISVNTKLLPSCRKGVWWYQGERKIWYPDGKKMCLAKYDKNQIVETLECWYNNGQKMLSVNHQNDRLDGILQFWHEDGNVWVEAKATNGKMSLGFKCKDGVSGDCTEINIHFPARILLLMTAVESKEKAAILKVDLERVRTFLMNTLNKNK